MGDQGNEQQNNEEREALEKEGRTLANEFVKKSASIAVHSIQHTSPIIDKFSIWLLVGIGATVAVIVSNIHNLISIVGLFPIKLALSSLIIGGLFGLMQKYVAIFLQVIELDRIKHDELKTPLAKKYTDIFNQFNERAFVHGIDILALVKDEKRVNIVANMVFPNYILFIKKRVNPVLGWFSFKTKKDNDEPDIGRNDYAVEMNRKIISLYIRQIVYTGAQAFFYVVFICIIALNI